MHLKSKHTTLSPYAKIVTSSSLASGALAYHPLHRTQRRRRELGRRTASRESADSLPPRATLFLTTSNFSEEPGLALPLRGSNRTPTPADRHRNRSGFAPRRPHSDKSPRLCPSFELSELIPSSPSYRTESDLLSRRHRPPTHLTIATAS